MEKFKICPICGIRNRPNRLECMDCETDLTNIKPVDEDDIREEVQKADEFSPELGQSQKKAQEASQSNSAITAAYIRICDCGAVNTAIARTCTACGEDISDIAPVRRTKNTNCRYVMTALDDSYQFEIPEGTTTIGREHVMQDYLSHKPYVSRCHARLTSRQGTVCIENLSTTNYTFVNNRRITVKTELKLHDEIGLGGSAVNGNRQPEAAYFRLEEPPCI